MLERCYGGCEKSVRLYQKRGIRVCDEWRGDHGFELFLAHVGRRPGDGHSLDRIDNDGDYEPDNVRWATASEQVRNRRPRSEWDGV